MTQTSLLQCFDVATRSLRNDGDSDQAGIVSLERWTQRDLHASRERGQQHLVAGLQAAAAAQRGRDRDVGAGGQGDHAARGRGAR